MQEEPFVFKSLTLPAEKDVGTYYENKETGFFYYGYCIELIYEIQKSMQVLFTCLISLGHAR